MARRQGRGWLSSIDLLPEEADEAVAWALDALAQREFPQTLILERFNEMLAALDPPAGPISASAFNRWSLRHARHARQLAETRQAAAALAERLDNLPEGDVGLMLVETIRSLIHDVLVDGMLSGESPSIKVLRDAAEAVERLAKARRSDQATITTARQGVLEKAADEVERAAVAKGLTADTIDAIRAEILGVGK